VDKVIDEGSKMSIFISISTTLTIQGTFIWLVDKYLQISFNIDFAYKIIIVPLRTSIL